MIRTFLEELLRKEYFEASLTAMSLSLQPKIAVDVTSAVSDKSSYVETWPLFKLIHVQFAVAV
jgi:hypothetical protein